MSVSWLSQDRYSFALAVFFILECIFQPLCSSSAKVLVLTARKYHTADLVFPSFLCLTIFSHGPRSLLETRNGFAFLFGLFLLFETGFWCVTLAVLGLPLWTRLASNSRDVSICLCFTSARIKGYLSPVVSLPTFEVGLSHRQSWEDSEPSISYEVSYTVLLFQYLNWYPNNSTKHEWHPPIDKTLPIPARTALFYLLCTSNLP